MGFFLGLWAPGFRAFGAETMLMHIPGSLLDTILHLLMLEYCKIQ